MKLELIIRNTGPPGGWYYKDPETGREFRPVAWNDMLPEITAHRKANNLPISATLKEQVEEQVCRHVPPEWCGNLEVQGRVAPLSFDQVLQGTAVLRDVVLHLIKGGLLVDQNMANDRGRICAHCHYNSGIAGCASCSMGKLRELIVKIVGQRVSSADNMIQACNICGCALKAKIWIPLDILQKHLSDDQNAAFPEWCWCKRVTS
jgi:hypothetical protein